MPKQGDALRFPLPYLKAWRAYTVISQQQLASKAGITRGTIIRLEQGAQANSATVHKLATALGISVHQLLREDPSNKEMRGVA